MDENRCYWCGEVSDHIETGPKLQPTCPRCRAAFRRSRTGNTALVRMSCAFFLFMVAFFILATGVTIWAALSRKF